MPPRSTPQDRGEMDLSYAQGWVPDDGAVLVGTVTDIAMGWSDFMNGHYPIVTVQPEDGGDPVAVHGFHAALFSQLKQLRPEKGERIGIKYEGQRPHKTNAKQTVAVYIVKIDGRTADVWGQLDPAPSFPAPDPEKASDNEQLPF